MSLSPSWRARLSPSEGSYGYRYSTSDENRSQEDEATAELPELRERRGHSTSPQPVININDTRTNSLDDGNKILPELQGGDEPPAPFPPTHLARASRQHRRARRIADRDGMTESASVRGADLNSWDVAALIINKMIGTGIFTTPGLVLNLTQNKASSIGLWVAGGAYAFISVFVYIEYGTHLPWNGGELIYLDEIFQVPELLTTVLFSGLFVVLGSSAGNSISFAKHVLLAAMPDISDSSELDKRLVTLIAVTILTVVCLLHYFSRSTGLLFNSALALYKITLLLAFFIGGSIASTKENSGTHDWNQQSSHFNTLGALIFVLYSYQGWENANYVVGELPVEIDRGVLRRGALSAIGGVTCLYVLVTIAYSLACPFGDLANNDVGVAIRFVPKVFGDYGGTAKICIALSAFGNLNAVVYTSSKVKQQIARQHIIPFYRFFSANDPQFGTPAGALFLHWIFSVILIGITPNSSDGYGFVIGLFTYSHLMIGCVLAYGLHRLRRMKINDEEWEPLILKNKILEWIVALIYAGSNLMILADSALTKASPNRYWWPIISVCTFGGSFVYWLVLRLWVLMSGSIDHADGLAIKAHIACDPDDCRTAEQRRMLAAARSEGNQRIVYYEFSESFGNKYEAFKGSYISPLVQFVLR
ncbi:amino acid permease-domain-containing protein [Trichophaea hybrida]|nr:amino acid permease-domain-containing protein [Trichophaea hybrida]